MVRRTNRHIFIVVATVGPVLVAYVADPAGHGNEVRHFGTADPFYKSDSLASRRQFLWLLGGPMMGQQMVPSKPRSEQSDEGLDFLMSDEDGSAASLMVYAAWFCLIDMLVDR